MKYLRIMTSYKSSILIVGALLFIVNQIFSQSNWATYTPPGKDFSIICPGGVMKYETKSIITGIGPLNNHVHYLDLPSDHPNFLYSINIVNYPEGSFDTDSTDIVDDLFETSVSALSESTGCKINYSQKSLLEDIPYVIVRLSDEKSNTSIKAKVLLKNDSVYSLMVYTLHDNKLNDFIDKFINSFVIY